jgi:hypothetical protein
MSATTRPKAANCAVITATVDQPVDHVLNGPDIVGSARWMNVFALRVVRDQPSSTPHGRCWGEIEHRAREDSPRLSSSGGPNHSVVSPTRPALAGLVFGKYSIPLCVADIRHRYRLSSAVNFPRVVRTRWQVTAGRVRCIRVGSGNNSGEFRSCPTGRIRPARAQRHHLRAVTRE